MEARRALLVRNPFQAEKASFEKLVRLRLDPVGDGGFRRSAVWRVVFEAAVVGWIMRRCDYNTVSESRLAPAVVRENRVGNGRGWGIFIPLREHDFHPVCRQHLKRAGKSRHGKGVRVHAEKQRTIDLLAAPGTGKWPD